MRSVVRANYTENGSKVLLSTFNYEKKQVFLTTSLLDVGAFFKGSYF